MARQQTDSLDVLNASSAAAVSPASLTARRLAEQNHDEAADALYGLFVQHFQERIDYLKSNSYAKPRTVAPLGSGNRLTIADLNDNLLLLEQLHGSFQNRRSLCYRCYCDCYCDCYCGLWGSVFHSVLGL